MSIANAVNVLHRTMAFGSLGDDRLNVLAFSAERLRFAAGDVLLTPGEEPARCLVVVEGEVDIADEGHGAPEQALGPGTTIGEMSLITGNPINLTVSGRVAGEVLVITRPLLERVAADFPDIVVRLREAMQERLAETLGRLADIEGRLRERQLGAPDRSGRGPERGRTAGPSREPRRPR